FYLPSHAETSDTIWTHYINGNVISVKFSPDGNYVYSGSTSNFVTKIEVSTNKVVKAFDTPKSLHSMDLSQDGKYLLLSGDTALIIVNTETGEIFKTFVYPFYLAPDKDDYITIYLKSVSFSFDGKYCGIVYGKVVLNRKDDNLLFDYLLFSPTENILVTGTIRSNQNNKVPIDVYEVGTWKLIKQFEGHTFQINGLKFSKDGNFLASWGNRDDIIKVWDMKTMTLKQNINVDKYLIYGVWDIEFLNNNSIIVSSETLINSKLRWEFILIDLNKQTKTIIAGGVGYIDLNTSNSKTLMAVGYGAGATLYSLDKTLDIQSDTKQPPIILFPNPVTKELVLQVMRLLIQIPLLTIIILK
ncbi:MAG: hypothetical protein NTW25_13390, partial [Candidatus Kapabacteria bacterium]|nr:hypothetical protein [Candidatus Kapabacteria bacterium]